MNALKKKLLAGEPPVGTIQEIMELLCEEAETWSEAKKAEVRDVLMKDLLLNMKCSPVIQ